ncbi:hypothetical protein EDB85DRAFT_1895018 [Lactarius pseudohatsudake]|nr:hypothetical protein EDB85DRAFT_1895018 [Lactarius pseudohatsudake]
MPEDPWWDWQAEEDLHVQERIWAAIEALEDTVRVGHLGLMPLATRIRVSELGLGFKSSPSPSDGKVRFSLVLCLFWPNREPDCRFSSGDLPNPDQNLGSGFTRAALVWSRSAVYTTKHMTWSHTVAVVVVVLVVVVVVGIVVVVVIPWLCRPLRSAQYRMWVRGDGGGVCVEGLNPHVDAARSRREMEGYTKPAGLGGH